MLIMVMAKPMQLTNVNDVPLNVSGACLATSEENSGESAVPNNPQQNRKIRKRYTELPKRKIGESKQHKPERARATVAILFAPNFCESTPPIIQEIPPEAITKKENNDTFNELVGCVLLYSSNIPGRNAQKV